MARRWTIEDTEKLRTLAQRRSATDIAAELGRSIGMIRVKACQLGLSLRLPAERPAHSQHQEPTMPG
jgi:hypothetical protein